MLTFTVPVKMCAYVCVWRQPSYSFMGVHIHPPTCNLSISTDVSTYTTHTNTHTDKKILLNCSHFHVTRHTNLDICLRAFKVISKPSTHFNTTLCSISIYYS